MIRVSAVLGAVVAFAALSAGCRVSVETKSRFVEDNITVTDTADWAGQKIVINADGVGVSVNGGLEVIADASVTKVTATSRFLAMAFDKPDADQSIVDAKGTFKITNTASQITIACGHGGSHGSSNAGESGCEKMVVRVPTGTDTQKLDIKALSGNGSVILSFGNAVASNIESNGQGDIDATLPATTGATISIVAEKADDIVGRLPAGFAADDIQLVADTDKITNSFTDAKVGAGAGGRGTAGTGLKSLKLASKEFAGSTGAVQLTSR